MAIATRATKMTDSDMETQCSLHNIDARFEDVVTLPKGSGKDGRFVGQWLRRGNGTWGRVDTIDFVEEMNDQSAKIDAKLKKTLNAFFQRHPDLARECILRRDWDGAPYALIFEGSDLYYHMQGEYGWDIHTDFNNSFDNTDFYPELQNSCTAGFYKR